MNFREKSDFFAYGGSSHIKIGKTQNEICGKINSSQVQEKKNKIAVLKKKPLREILLERILNRNPKIVLYFFSI
ncbi:hypothetical protein DLM75_20410 [Leptospira stimsonii]|uniref:Uncharacterized protein n=1 Tax=Leptospira stimsonii TaxID=2202203 RepID=A0A396YXB1_9LEPT|nr:hypothetical protein DLM75_20410 [Leptospira stimsonii]